jgi:hypothetical protein
MSIKRAISVAQLMKTKFKGLEFQDEWLASLGKPQLTGSWLIWGPSANGKTRFALQLAKYLTNFNVRVAYDSLEEGASLSMRNAFQQCNMKEAAGKIVLLDKEPVLDLVTRLKMRKSPDVVIIDSIQYTGMNYNAYKSLIDSFRTKLFIFISHADGRLPEGRVAKSIRYDAFVKIWVEGYTAYPVSRFGGGEPYPIWPEKADLFINQNKNKNENENTNEN